MAGRHDHDGGPPAAPGIEGAAQRGRLDHAFGGAQDDAALVAVTGDEDQACLAAAAAQRARHIGGGGDLERRAGDRVGGQGPDVAHAVFGKLVAHGLDAVVEGRAAVVASNQDGPPAIGRHRAAGRRDLDFRRAHDGRRCAG